MMELYYSFLGYIASRLMISLIWLSESAKDSLRLLSFRFTLLSWIDYLAESELVFMRAKTEEF